MLFNDLVLIFVLARLSCGVDVFLSLYFTSFFSLWGFVLFFFQGFPQFYLSFAILLNRIMSKSLCR